MRSTKLKQRKKREAKQAKEAKKLNAPLKQKCYHHYTHLGGMKTPPYEQFYQCIECGKRLST